MISGNSLWYHKNSPFSTKDVDNDEKASSCSYIAHGAWWYGNCYTSNLNGKYYLEETHPQYDEINWKSWRSESLKTTSMKMRPAGFTSGEDVMPHINTDK